MKYTFKCEDEGLGYFTNTVEFEANHIDDVIANFELFLKGSGFHFGGVLDFQEEGVPEIDEPDADLKVWSSMIDTLTQEPLESTKHKETCPRCNLTKETMQGVMCWDSQCPVRNQV